MQPINKLSTSAGTPSKDKLEDLKEEYPEYF
jgi:hypothetical protein